MKLKQILEIHEVNDQLFKLDLENYILTFDDGLFSQFLFFEEIKKINTTKIFFITTGIISPENQIQNSNFITCDNAHKLYFQKGDNSNYMKWSQVKEIASTNQCYIGGHSHHHLDLRKLKLGDQFNFLKKDTMLMMSEFKKNNIEAKHFCFPYNIQYPGYIEYLKKNGFDFFYGSERISVDTI